MNISRPKACLETTLKRVTGVGRSAQYLVLLNISTDSQIFLLQYLLKMALNLPLKQTTSAFRNQQRFGQQIRISDHERGSSSPLIFEAGVYWNCLLCLALPKLQGIFFFNVKVKKKKQRNPPYWFEPHTHRISNYAMQNNVDFQPYSVLDNLFHSSEIHITMGTESRT